jgi:putative membrane protein
VKLFLRILINALAFWLTAYIMPGLQLTTDLIGIVIVAVIFGLINILIRPIVRLFSLPVTILTLGLFSLVINAVMLLLTAALAGNLLNIDGGFFQKFFTALIASIILSIISTIFNRLFVDK